MSEDRVELGIVDTSEAEEVSRAAASTAKWYCPSCGKSNTGNFCYSCGKKKPAAASTAKKPASTAAKKPASTAKKPASTAKKPASSTAKKPASTTSTSTTLKLTAAEKKLITSYRKCNTATKQLIVSVVEKAAGGDFSKFTDLLANLLK